MTCVTTVLDFWKDSDETKLIQLLALESRYICICTYLLLSLLNFLQCTWFICCEVCCYLMSEDVEKNRPQYNCNLICMRQSLFKCEKTFAHYICSFILLWNYPWTINHTENKRIRVCVLRVTLDAPIVLFLSWFWIFLPQFKISVGIFVMELQSVQY